MLNNDWLVVQILTENGNVLINNAVKKIVFMLI